METKIKKTADMTAYIREYKRKTYARDKEMILAQNRAYYAKKNYGIDGVEEYVKKYEKNALPIMLRIKKELTKLYAIRPNLVKEVIDLVQEFEENTNCEENEISLKKENPKLMHDEENSDEEILDLQKKLQEALVRKKEKKIRENIVEYREIEISKIDTKIADLMSMRERYANGENDEELVKCY